MTISKSKIAIFGTKPIHTRFTNIYASMITNLFWPEIENMDLDNMWFQHTTLEHLAIDEQIIPNKC